MRFEFSAETSTLYDHETNKEYLFSDESNIEWNGEAEAFYYLHREFGIWEVTGENVELLHACDKSCAIMQKLCQQMSSFDEIPQQLLAFLQISRFCLACPTFDTLERHAMCLEQLTQLNSGLELFLTDATAASIFQLLVTAFQIGSSFSRESNIWSKKEADAQNVINQRTELADWFVIVFDSIPEDYKGGPNGPISSVHKDYVTACQQMQPPQEAKHISTFRRHFLRWLPSYAEQCLREEFRAMIGFQQLFEEFKGKDDYFKFGANTCHVFEVSKADMRYCYKQLKKQPKKSIKVQRLIRWIENYDIII